MSEIHVYYCLTRAGAVLSASGPDAFTFLQSQFSNELRHPEVENPVTYGLWLDHKGKIQADSFIIQKSPEEFILVSYDCPVTVLKGHLAAHLIADDVTLGDETETLALMHIWTEQYDESLAELIEGLADGAGAESWMGFTSNLFCSWDLLAPREVLYKIGQELEAQGIEAGAKEAFQAVRIILGIPGVPRDAGPGDLPQETGLDLHAVSYDKGCYIGQEIMQRLHTQAHVTRNLWQVGWDVKVTRQDGEETVPLYADDAPAGELRSFVLNESGGLGLAMLKNRAVAGQPLLSFSPKGPKVVKLVRNLVEG
jgi:folate-binding protein YgfZ